MGIRGGTRSSAEKAAYVKLSEDQKKHIMDSSIESGTYQGGGFKHFSQKIATHPDTPGNPPGQL